MDAMLDALAELLIDLVVDVFLHGNLGKQLEALLREVLLEESCLLESLTREAQWQILRVGDALAKIQPLWHEIIAIIRDEDTADAQLGMPPTEEP